MRQTKIDADEVIVIEATRYDRKRGFYTETVDVSVRPEVYEAIDDWTQQNQYQQLPEVSRIPSRWIYDDNGVIIGIASGTEERLIESNPLDFSHPIFNAKDIIDNDVCRWCGSYMVNSFTHRCAHVDMHPHEIKAKVWGPPEIGEWHYAEDTK